MRSQNDTEIRVPLAKWVQFFGGGQDPYVAGPHEGAKSKRLLAFAFNQL